MAGKPQASLTPRLLSPLLGSAGIALAVLFWRMIAGHIAADAAWSGLAARLAAACFSLVPLAAIIFAMVLAQSVARFITGAFDPTWPDAGGARFLRVNQRVISNSVEQAVIFIPALLALAGIVPDNAMPGVVALSLCQAVMRVLFWAGYLLHPIARAPGMAGGFILTGASFAAIAYVWAG